MLWWFSQRARTRTCDRQCGRERESVTNTLEREREKKKRHMKERRNRFEEQTQDPGTKALKELRTAKQGSSKFHERLYFFSSSRYSRGFIDRRKIATSCFSIRLLTGELTSEVSSSDMMFVSSRSLKGVAPKVMQRTPYLGAVHLCVQAQSWDLRRFTAHSSPASQA